MAGQALDRIDSANAIPTIVAAEMLGALTRYSSMIPLVTRDYDDDVARFGESVRILEAGAVTVQDKAAETPLTFSTASPTDQTVTLNRHKVVTVMIEDVAKVLARPALAQAYGEKGAIAIGEAVDDDLLRLATDAAVTTEVGAAGTAPTRNTIIDARERLNSAKAPRGDRHLIFAPSAESNILKDAGINPFNNQFAGNGEVPELFGFTPHVNQGVTITAGTPNRTNNLAFQRQGLVLASRPLPAPPAGQGVAYDTVAQEGMIVRVLSSYSHDNLAMKLTFDILYGVKVLRGAFVVRLAS